MLIEDKHISTALKECMSGRETSKTSSNDNDLSHNILVKEEVGEERKECPYITR